MVSTTASLALSCLAFVVAPAVILFALSFATLHTVEYGLDFNAITMTLDSKTWDQAGLKFLGFGHTFIKFPRVIQTIEFTPSRRGLLHTRTADGLPLTLGLSFQFRYLPARLYQLYLDYQGEEELVYVNNARAVISNTACNFSAYTFFNDKQGIAAAMQKELNRKFGDSLGAYVEALQISNVELPDVFQEAIVTSISTKQNITRSQRYLENMQVTFAQRVMVAEQELTQTVAIANGTAKSRLEAAAASATITAQTVSAEMVAFLNLSQALGMTPSQTLDYLWWDELEAGKDTAKDFLVGINPAAFVNQK
ncbi:hypothetical protein EMIHUDRAFT_455548 [Emiliania huxleyi CCMP1516]|uniref:Band 7 domain-containing protein n=2 Tax=Emiliania huxleyi TaxID=2903 RepID=A0A0D3KFX0_EMIH1|nr:hypothetical protein EMIHUDRAFT_455548 [Emiliania huxleyi CCMP1516]EOD34655.1 hypothetical protein EMIHUDRAFT_455548 [Emiliania huxleyi CCMP1516]|mmetsp:Transcript_2448/g.7273  ORF Transcript_2448/g.7273 Transcript_2448/m.7273 type:complete len:309 (+) Transcript_2448:70-996(+)|eukprot:CAMPEP_0202782618 /NCGR_PEP_ID=MMETSP1388-20130828/62956_1 /ASSEMBLY_ACC=CAM_ASM_000864 /TAXON_ID=37098 /ORGANISM="Isochrysis sp, Strain CCMP1244" /LENGTH=308 /DNA_ID=CAMNT_0049452069 /DNA_START=28 /DNA_END=954 /DNA_ORIENTATION=-